ncbi:MAG: YegP family protein, partial [Bacteroidia bacterium]|nr:YegP family protein [Bacteroidia bacterium]
MADNYKSLYDFTQASHSGEAGFDPYQSEKNEQFYFLFNDKQGKVFLFSQPYPSIDKRNEGIRESIRCADSDSNFGLRKDEDGFFFTLKDNGGTELLRSRPFANEEERDTSLNYFRIEAPSYIEKFSPRLSKLASNDYDFGQESRSQEKGFELFRSEKNRLYFFHFNDKDGNALLYSEGYSSSRARRNGIRSVIKNGSNPENYRFENETNRYFFTLKAENHQEIARSRYFNSRNEGDQALAFLIHEIPGFEEQFEVDDSTKSLNTSLTMNEHPINNPSNSGAEDEYDLSQLSQSGEKGFERFLSNNNNEYYFHFNDEDGTAFFYSEGYKSDKSRDNGIRSVIKNSIKEAHYSDKKDEEGLFFTLRAGNYQEIGRSKYFESEEEMSSSKDWFMKTVHRSAKEFKVELEVPKELLSAPMARSFATSKSKGDDYDLDQAGTTTDAGFDSFHSEKHGQHYFHFNGADGQPL